MASQSCGAGDGIQQGIGVEEGNPQAGSEVRRQGLLKPPPQSLGGNDNPAWGERGRFPPILEKGNAVSLQDTRVGVSEDGGSRNRHSASQSTLRIEACEGWIRR